MEKIEIAKQEYNSNARPELTARVENMNSWDVELTDEEFSALEDSLNGLTVYGHRGLGGF